MSTLGVIVPTNVEHPAAHPPPSSPPFPRPTHQGRKHRAPHPPGPTPFAAAVPAPQRTKAASAERRGNASAAYGNARRRNPAASVTVDRPRERRSVPNSSSSRSTRFTVAREVPARLASSSCVSGTVTSSPSP